MTTHQNTTFIKGTRHVILNTNTKHIQETRANYNLVVWPKFKLPTYGLKFDTLPT